MITERKALYTAISVQGFFKTNEMRIYDVEAAQKKLLMIQKKDDSTILQCVLLILLEATTLLFVGPVYNPLKWYQFKRIWKLASLTIKMIKKVVGEFRDTNDEEILYK